MSDNGDIFRERIREVVQARIGDYLPNARNPKIHGELQNERLRAILENWGKVGVLLTFVDDDGRDVVFDGHARRNQNPDETWYIAKTDLTRQEANELVLMYDPIAALATMDRAAMDGLLREVQTADASLTAMLGELAADAGLYFGQNGNGEGAADAEPTIDRAAELQQQWQTATGQLWILPSRDGKGEHRLVCGDCTDAAVVERVMGGERADMVTDPPYGMHLDTDWSDAVGSMRSIGAKNNTRGNVYEPVIGDSEPYDPAPLFELYRFDEIFLFGADYYCERLPNKNEGSWLVWDKRKESQADAIGSEFELIWSKNKHKRRVLRHDWFGFLSSSNVAEARNRVHPTQKPTSLIEDLIGQWCKQAVIADWYAGSGTTIIAAENLSRYARAIEISPAYVAVCLDRYYRAFDIKPELVTP